jgi:HNH endonuclease
MTICEVNDCARPAKNAGMCWKHYSRVRRYGDPTVTLMRPLDGDFPTWFWSQFRPNGECWDWKGCVNSAGYGAVSRGGKAYGTHRLSWELANGRPVPDGMDVMHSCDRRICGNPAHLSPGTRKANMRDMVAKGRR